jgi:hypothetical protein
LDAEHVGRQRARGANRRVPWFSPAAAQFGNFLELGRLQAFVADQSGAKLGSLTCISTHAVIDASKKTQNGVVQGWMISDANALIRKCRGFTPQSMPAGVMNAQAIAQTGSPAA